MDQHGRAGFSIQTPPEWREIAGVPGVTMVVAEPVDEAAGFATNVNVIVQRADGSAEETAQAGVSFMRDRMTDFALIDVERLHLQPERDAVQVTARFRQGLHHMSMHQAYVVDDEMCFVLTGTVRTDDFPEKGPLVQAVISSFDRS